MEEVTLVLRQPALVGVARTAVGHPGERHGVGLVGHVDDRQVVLAVEAVLDAVGVDADLAAAEVGVRTVVDNALGVVDVPVVLEAPGELGVLRVVDVDHVQAAAAHCRDSLVAAGAHGVGVARVGVDVDVVRRTVLGVVRVHVVGGVGPVPVAQAGQVEDLHAVVAVLGDHEGVVLVHLDVTPGAATAGRCGRQDAQDVGPLGVTDVDEDGAVAGADERVVLAGAGVGPAPDVVDEGGAQLGVGHVAEHVDAVAGEEIGGHALATRGMGAGRVAGGRGGRPRRERIGRAGLLGGVVLPPVPGELDVDLAVLVAARSGGGLHERGEDVDVRQDGRHEPGGGRTGDGARVVGSSVGRGNGEHAEREADGKQHAQGTCTRRDGNVVQERNLRL